VGVGVTHTTTAATTKTTKTPDVGSAFTMLWEIQMKIVLPLQTILFVEKPIPRDP